EPHLTRADQVAWLDRLEREHDNFRGAFRWSVERAAAGELFDRDCSHRQETDPGEVGLRLGGALWRFWVVRGYLSEGRECMTRVLGLAAKRHTFARGRALVGMGFLATNQNEHAWDQAPWEVGL